MKNINPKTPGTKHLNVVTNAQHGACLMFDRKGRGISPAQRYRRDKRLTKTGATSDMFNKAFLLFRAQLKNIILSMKQVSPLRTG